MNRLSIRQFQSVERIIIPLKLYLKLEKLHRAPCITLNRVSMNTLLTHDMHMTICFKFFFPLDYLLPNTVVDLGITYGGSRISHAKRIVKDFSPRPLPVSMSCIMGTASVIQYPFKL